MIDDVKGKLEHIEQLWNGNREGNALTEDESELITEMIHEGYISKKAMCPDYADNKTLYFFDRSQKSPFTLQGQKVLRL